MNFRQIISVAALLGSLTSALVYGQAVPTDGQVAFRTETVKPNYLPPAEVLQFLGVDESGGNGMARWSAGEGHGWVQIRRSDVSNRLILSGSPADVDALISFIHEADVPPRQIAIEAKIVEIDQSKSRDLGFDWDRILNTGKPRIGWAYNDINADNVTRSHSHDEQTTIPPGGPPAVSERSSNYGSRQGTTGRRLDVSANLDLSQVLSILDQSGAATIRNAPRILTLNNRRATILDGQRVTYVTRYSSYTNLFVTDSMDAGLTLSVLPSLGESGYLTLQIRAELTSLLDANISGSPIKDGQMVENTVVIKDGETVLLGGFQRTVEKTTKRRFPILGYVLPFLFSHESTAKSTSESFVLLTPRIVDLAVALDDSTKQMLEVK